MPYAEKLKDTLEKTMAHIYFSTSGHVNNSSNGYAKEDEKGKKRKEKRWGTTPKNIEQIQEENQ